MRLERLPLRPTALGILCVFAALRVASSRADTRNPAPPVESGEALASRSRPAREGTSGDPAGRRPDVLAQLGPDFTRVESAARQRPQIAPVPDAEARRRRLETCVRRLALARGTEAIFDPAATAIARAAVSLGRDGLVALVGIIDDARSAPDARALACGLLEGLRERDALALATISNATGGAPSVLRRAATHALAICAPERFNARFQELARDADPLVRLHALVGLARVGDLAAVAKLEAEACAEGPGFVRSASLGALYAVDRESARDALERCRERVQPAARPVVSLLLAKQGRRSPDIDADVIAASTDDVHPERRTLARELLARQP